MRTETINIYKFSELPNNLKDYAIEEYRQSMYEYFDPQFILDDEYLLEPVHKELENINGYNNLKEPLFKRKGKIYWDIDRGRYLDVSDGLIIVNDWIFLEWLGINDELKEKIYYSIDSNGRNQNSVIDFRTDEELTEDEEEILEKAKEKFNDHLEIILDRISDAIEYEFSDENIRELLEINEYEFDENGNRY